MVYVTLEFIQKYLDPGSKLFWKARDSDCFFNEVEAHRIEGFFKRFFPLASVTGQK